MLTRATDCGTGKHPNMNVETQIPLELIGIDDLPSDYSSTFRLFVWLFVSLLNTASPSPEYMYSRGKMMSFISHVYTTILWEIYVHSVANHEYILYTLANSICMYLHLIISYEYHVLQNKNKHILQKVYSIDVDLFFLQGSVS